MRSILLAEPIYVVSPVGIALAHDGLIIRGLGRNTGILTNDTSIDALIYTGADGCPSVSFENCALGGLAQTAVQLTGPTGTGDTYGGVRFMSCRFTSSGAPVQCTSIKELSFHDCNVTDSGTASLLDTCQDSGIYDSRWRCATNLTDCLGLNVSGNRNLGAMTMTGTCAAVVIDGNILTGNLNTASGGGNSVIVGNYRNGFTITAAGGDTNASNHV